jgi:hypothetical protein
LAWSYIIYQLGKENAADAKFDKNNYYVQDIKKAIQEKKIRADLPHWWFPE